ncbi:MAG: PKD domain-containing protein, partial [Flavobacterium sp.]|uniref:choice-of-anchor L domain-containing protein n=1 Tax=Flavobacterium sp. TaxID=239 RepID=UPI001220899C
MKKITLLLVMLLVGLSGFSQGFVENFDDPAVVAPPGDGTWPLPSGTWRIFDNGIGTINWSLNVPATSFPANTAPNAAFINRQNIGANQTSIDYLVSTVSEVPANPQLRFNTRTTVAGNNFTVFEVRIAPGTSDPTNPASYTTLLQTWNDDALTIPFDQYGEKVIDLDPALTGSTIYIAFVKIYTQPTGGINGERWLIDDVRFIEACQDADIETLSATSTATDATLTWDGLGGNAWEVHVLPTADTFNPTAGTPFSVTGTATTTVTATTQGTVIGAFTPLTCYKFYVRSVCEFSTGEWVGPFEFCTQALPPECGGNYVDDGGIDDDYPADSASVITICPDDANPDDIVTVTFTAFNTETGWDGMYVYDGNSVNAPLIPSENESGFNGDLDTPGAYWGNEIPGPFEASSADGCLTFQFFSDGVFQFDGWAANVTCGPPPTCPKPTGLTATVATDESVTLSWDYAGPPGATFEIIALPENAAAPTAGSVGIPATGGSPFVYPNLPSATCFDFYVRAHCSDTDTSTWSVVETFCTQVTPPECGGNYVDEGGLTQNYPNNSNSIVTICPDAANPDYIVTVTFTTFSTETNWDGLYVFDGNSTNAPMIASENPANNVPFGEPGSYWGNTIPGPFEATNADGCLTFLFSSDGSVNLPGWVANVTCGPPPTCPKVTALTVGTPTDDAVNVSWTPVGTETSWQVYAVPCNSPAPTVTTPDFTLATTNSILLEGLDSATCYDIYVIAVCSPTDASAPAGPKDVTTQVAPPVCGGNFVDEGGPANYPNSSNSIVTICPEDANPDYIVTVTFTQFQTETNWDALYVFDGANTDAPQIATNNPAGNVPAQLPGGFWGSTIPGPFTSSSPDGCLTFWFSSDTSVNQAGWLANVTCNPPPTCPRPWGVEILDATETTASVEWTEVGSATQWQVLVLPQGSDVPTASTPGWQTANAHPFEYGPLPSGAQLVAYVRAVCSSTDISDWSNPASFNTDIANDECATAINVPVNPDAQCGQTVAGTLIGATGSALPTQCVGTADDDVWFMFTATNTSHYVSLLNITGSTTFLTHAIYTGGCDGLTLVECTDGNQTILNGLTVGQVYYIRVYTWTSTGNQTSSFDVCVGTIPPPISTSETDFTTQELITNVLINTNCATVENITTITGTNFGSVNGIGYFNKNGSTFPFEEGVIMSTGNILNAPGPNDVVLSDGPFAGWPGDTDLEDIIFDATGVPMESNNATIMEFDFVPITPTISFDFIFASEEYGTFQCSYSDSFAFLLTDLTDATPPTNLAVLPSTTIPVSVVTIRDQAYNAGCNSQNPQYFDEYYELPEGIDPLAAPINFNGVTVPLTATSTVIPGHNYHIKLVIADRLDNAFDSAVFLKKGSFNFGNIELGADFLEADGTALCDGVAYTLSSGLDAVDYTFVWMHGDDVLPETTPSIVVTEPGDYTVTATFQNSTCSATDTVTIEYYPPILPNTPANLVECSNLQFAEFVLSDANAEILGSMNPADYTITYYATMEEATTGVGTPLPNNYTNTTPNTQVVYAHVENEAGCFGVVTLTLTVQDLAPQFTVTPDFAMCSGDTGTITVTPGNFDPAAVTYSWTLDGGAPFATTQTITVTAGGTYVVTVNNAGCTATGTTIVTITPTPITDAPADVTACDSYVLPAFVNSDNQYWTGPNCTGIALAVGATISDTQIIYVCSNNGTCSGPTNQFEVTINDTPVLGSFQNLQECSSVTLPTLTIGNYYTDPNGVGLITDLTFDTPGTYTVYVYAETGTTPNCVAATNPSFTVTVLPGFTVPELDDATACDSGFELEPLSSGNYFTGPNGTGTPYIAGDIITQTTLMYVYADDGNGNCPAQSDFNITISPDPQFTITGGCQGNAYVLTSEPVAGSFDPATAVYSWTSSNGTIVSGGDTAAATVSGAGTYTLTVSVSGCSGDEPFVATTTSCTIQKGISANGDGANDYF